MLPTVLLLLITSPGILLNQYRANPKQFVDHQQIEVRGKVVQASSVVGFSFITFETGIDKDGDVEESVVCLLGRGKSQEIKKIHKGQTITVLGEFNGRTDHIRLQKCTIKTF